MLLLRITWLHVTFALLHSVLPACLAWAGILGICYGVLWLVRSILDVGVSEAALMSAIQQQNSLMHRQAMNFAANMPATTFVACPVLLKPHEQCAHAHTRERTCKGCRPYSFGTHFWSITPGAPVRTGGDNPGDDNPGGDNPKPQITLMIIFPVVCRSRYYRLSGKNAYGICCINVITLLPLLLCSLQRI